jgi:hypothetical protein
MDLPDPILQGFDLLEDIVPLLGRAIPHADAEGDRIKVSQVLTTPITQTSAPDDPDLEAFLKSDQNRFQYHLIRVVCTFTDLDEDRFESAWIMMSLSNPENPEEESEQPISWSMEPIHMTTPTGIVNKIGIKGSVQCVTGELQHERHQGDETYLETRYLATSRPTWYLSPTRRHRIDGDHDLRVITRSPTGQRGQAEVSLGADIRRRNLLLFHGKVALPDKGPYRRVVFGG